MKPILISLIITVLSFTTSNYLNGQQRTSLKASSNNYLGTWVAKDGNKSYTLEFIKEDLYFKENNTIVEYILGKITYQEKGIIVKESKYDRLNSIIYGHVSDDNNMALIFRDEGRKVWQSFTFAIDDNEPTKAVWKFGDKKGGWLKAGWNEENEPDIPDGLTFTKIK